MTDLTTILVAAGICIGAVGMVSLVRAACVWRRFRSERVVTCPETGHLAAVRIDIRHAASTTLTRGGADVRLAACSRWPSRGPCDEDCLAAAQDPESRVPVLAAHWYTGKACVYCGGPVCDDAVVGHHGALLAPDGSTREWSDVAAQDLPDALRTSRPVCWNCHVAETLRRLHPELVTDRSNVRRRS